MLCRCNLADADFKFIWKVKNISLWSELKNSVITSGTFSPNCLFGTSLELVLKNKKSKSFDLYLERTKDDNGPKEVYIKLIIRILVKRALLKTVDIVEIIKVTRYSSYLIPSLLEQLEVTSDSPVSSLESLLTIECFFKKSQNKIPQICKCTTELQTEGVSFVWKTHISAVNLGEESINVATLLKQAPPLNISLHCKVKIGAKIACFSFDGREIFRYNMMALICQITLLNKTRTKYSSIESTHAFDSTINLIWNFPLYFELNDLENFNEPLTFRFDLKFSYASFTSRIYEIKQMQENIPERASEQYNILSILPDILQCSHSEDFHLLLSKSLFHNVGLRVQNEIFSAHKDLLCARSPVLERKIMEAPEARVIDITDMDRSTLRSFLKCLYTNLTLERLQEDFSSLFEADWTYLKRLYIAADRYEVSLLKNACSLFLASNLINDNVRECLKLAEAYKDEILKDAVNNYFTKNTSDIENGVTFKRLLHIV